LLASSIGAAVLPALLVLLDLKGIGSQPLYWTATAVSLALLCAWPLAASKARAGAGRTAALSVAVLTVLLLSFLAGSAATTLGVRTWLPQAPEAAA
jgi:hypothetical protein